MEASACENLDFKYQFDNVIYNVVATPDIHNRLQNDVKYATSYFQENEANLEFEIATETPRAGPDLEIGDKTFKWSSKLVLLLLEEYRLRNNKFRDPKIKKRTLWLEIEEVFRRNGHNTDPDMLDKKFRNLKKTFIKIRDNNNKTATGRGRVNWEYYDVFMEIFHNDKTSSINTDTPKSYSRSQVLKLRSKHVDVEQARVQELQKLTAAVEENNNIQRQRNGLLEKFIQNMIAK